MPEVESQNFAKTALPEILPVILSLLLKQDPDADEDEWNVSMAASTCLASLAQAVGDKSRYPDFTSLAVGFEEMTHYGGSMLLDGYDPDVRVAAARGLFTAFEEAGIDVAISARTSRHFLL